jgi:uncharacterized protein (TIGR03437 family)
MVRLILRTSLAVVVLYSTAGILLAASPIAFEENRGQAAGDFAFLARDGNSRIFLTRHGGTIAVTGRNIVRVGLAGANPAAPIGMREFAARSNYLIGADPARWHIGIPLYHEVRYAHAYPKIDLVWHGRNGELEHDFEVAPGGDPRRIQFEIEGATPAVTAENDLVAGTIRLHQPHAYQDGREIACRYQLRGGSVGFVLGKYDRTRPLTIDPVLSFSTFLGGIGADSANSVAVDGSGNIYVAGTTNSANFPISKGALQPAPAGGTCGTLDRAPCADVFITKFTSDGSTLLFSTYLGGIGQNSVTGMAIDKSGNVYLAGIPGNSDFPKLTPLPGNAALPLGPYVAKLSSDGSALLYSTMLPQPTPGYSVAGLAVDAAGSVYLTGSASGALPLVNALQTTLSQPPVFKTIDATQHWQGLGNGLPSDLVYSITVDPTNPQTLYLGMSQGLYKSTDGGNHWTTLLQGPPPQAPHPGILLSPESVAVDPSHPQTVYFSSIDNGIYKSTDGGTTWSPAGAGAGGIAFMIAIDPANTTTLYAATGNGLYKSTDGAATWNATPLVAAPNAIFSVRSVVLDPSTPSTVYAGTSSGVMKSLDAGVTWTALTNGFSQSLDITTLIIDPVNPKTLYATTTINFAPYRTTDGGAHWTQGQWSSAGIFEYVVWLMVDPLVHTTIWAVTEFGLKVSRDSGSTWVAPPTDLPYYNLQRLASGSDGAIYVIASNFSTDAFAMKLDATGTKILYSTYLGGTGPDYGQSIAVDSAGRAYIAGYTSSFDFPVANALQPRPAGLLDGFVTVLDATGSHLAWSTYLGGGSDDRPQAIAVDPAGNVHVAGSTDSGDFPLRQASQAHLAGSASALLPNAFAAKLKGDGSSLMFSTYLGGSGGDSALAVAGDPAGNTYVAGYTGSKDFPVVNAIQSGLAGTQNAFVAAWNGQTGALQSATYLGGSGSDTANAIAVDAAGNTYIAGSTSSPDFPRKYAFQYSMGACAAIGFGCANLDAFLAKIAPAIGPSLALAGVTNAASYGATVSPGEIFSVFGTALAVTPATALAAPLPVKLADVSVSVNGVAAPLFYVSPGQINAQIPYETAVGTAQIQVTSSAGTGLLKVQVAPAAPAIFTVNSLGTGAGAIEHGLTGQLVTAAAPATVGEIISVYCTGLGALNPPAITGAPGPVPPAQTALAVQVSIGGLPAQVTYAGLAPGFAGLYQINAQVPAGTPSGAQPLQASAGGASSNAVTIAVQ